MTDIREWAKRDRTFKVEVVDGPTGDTSELEGRMLLGQDAMAVGTSFEAARGSMMEQRAATIRALPKVFPALADWPQEDLEALYVRTGGMTTDAPLRRAVMRSLGLSVEQKAAGEVAADADGPT